MLGRFYDPKRERLDANATKGSFYNEHAPATNGDRLLRLRIKVVDQVRPSVASSIAETERQAELISTERSRSGTSHDNRPEVIAQEAATPALRDRDELEELPSVLCNGHCRVPLEVWSWLECFVQEQLGTKILANRLWKLLRICTASSKTTYTEEQVLAVFEEVAQSAPLEDENIILQKCARLCKAEPQLVDFMLELHGRHQYESIFSTTEDQLGFCCSAIGVQDGDMIALAEGSNFPLILRRATGAGQRGYRFIGPALVTGMMDGSMWPEDLDELEIIELV